MERIGLPACFDMRESYAAIQSWIMIGKFTIQRRPQGIAIERWLI